MLASGRMVLDVLVDQGVPIAFARTQVRPRLVEPGGRLGEAMGASRVTAALELTELMHLAGGEAVQYSIERLRPRLDRPARDPRAGELEWLNPAPYPSGASSTPPPSPAPTL